MKKLTGKMLLLITMGTIGSSFINAAPINVNIYGTVIASPCIVNNNNSNINVNLGNDIQAKSLAAAGSGSVRVPFNIELTACPPGTNAVTASFSGIPDDGEPLMYKNTGSAANVAVELSQQDTGKILGNNTILTVPVNIDRTVTYALAARAYSKTGSVMPGSISSVVQVNFTYN